MLRDCGWQSLLTLAVPRGRLALKSLALPQLVLSVPLIDWGWQSLLTLTARRGRLALKSLALCWRVPIIGRRDCGLIILLRDCG